jgi:hypothetical protein
LKDQRLHDIPAVRILYKGGEPRKTDFHYRSDVGQLNYLTASTRPELMMAVHQCARFSANPRLQHEQAIKRTVRYLKRTGTKGLILWPDISRGLECHMDADFVGGFSPEYSDDATTCYSQTRYIIWCAGCPLIWSFKLQTTVALSATEAEYIAFSTSLRDVIYVMQLLEELMSFNIKIPFTPSTVCCKVFEDNVGLIELAKAPKLRPRTKHIAIQYHHFYSQIAKKLITIQHDVTTLEKVADIATKPLPRDQFKYL